MGGRVSVVWMVALGGWSPTCGGFDPLVLVFRGFAVFGPWSVLCRPGTNQGWRWNLDGC
jgi:hypothetical protein